MYITSLEIDDHILEKIESKHDVKFEEVEEVCNSSTKRVRKGKQGLYKLFGQTESGRFLLVVLAYKGDGDFKVVTSRTMTDNEKRLYKGAR